MSENKSPLKILATLTAYIGYGLVCVSIGYCVAYPKSSIWAALGVGVALGTPFVLVSMWLERKGTGGVRKGGFWATRSELWGIAGVLLVFACFLAPLFLLVGVGWMLPAGDGWDRVTLRLVFMASAWIGYYCWIMFAWKKFPPLFRGKIPDSTLEPFIAEPPEKEPRTVRQIVIGNWQLPVISLVAFLVAGGFLRVDGPAMDLDIGTGRANRMVKTVVWLRGNPNTVISSSVLVGLGTLGYYVYLIRDSLGRAPSELTEDD